MTWAYRAMREFELASRTWWSTYTLTPERHQLVRSQLSVDHWFNSKTNGVSRPVRFSELPAEEQFARIHGYEVRYLTRYMKRFRKGRKGDKAKWTASQDRRWKPMDAVAFRYLLVVEPHTAGSDSPSGGANYGMPHYHAFWHEISPLHQMRKSDLEGEWPYGHSAHRVVDTEDFRDRAWYLAKYVGKAPGGRVCASIGYGDESHVRKQILHQDLIDFAEMPLLTEFSKKIQFDDRSNNIATGGDLRETMTHNERLFGCSDTMESE